MNYPVQPQQPNGYYPPQPAGYYPPQPPQYATPQAQAQPQYAPQAPPAPAPVDPRGTLEDFNDQPTGGAPATTKFFSGRPQGSWLQFQVSRDLNNNDVRVQKDDNGNIQTFKSSGKPKFVLVVPVTVLQSSDGSHPAIFEGGAGSVWLKGVTSDAWKSAMATAGISDPSAALRNGKLGGAVVTMVSAGEKAPWKPSYSPTKLYDFTYQPSGREETPDLGRTHTDATVAPAAPPAVPPAVPPVAPVYQAPPAPPVAPAAPPAAPPAPVYQAPVAPPAPPAPPAAPTDPEKAALLARLTGGQ